MIISSNTYLEIDNLIQSESAPPEKTLRTTKSLPQDDSIDQEIQRKLVKKKKKAKFELPHPNVVKSLPRATSSSNSKRLQRRISADFVPIFADNIDDVTTNQLTPETTKTSTTSLKPTKKKNNSLHPKVSSLPRKRTGAARIQPRGEGYRIKYRVIKQILEK